MKATIPYIEQKFEESNQQMFAGQLPKLPIELSDAKTFLGVCAFKTRKGKDHKKMYQNRPIYWLFTSKKGAFQCIAYMHRMNAYTAERIRTKYLLPHIEWLMQKQSEMEENAANLSTAERKKLDSIRKQIDECREYHDRLHVVADEQIDFDLDDGVVVNYAKFGYVVQKIK